MHWPKTRVRTTETANTPSSENSRNPNSIPQPRPGSHPSGPHTSSLCSAPRSGFGSANNNMNSMLPSAESCANKCFLWKILIYSPKQPVITKCSVKFTRVNKHAKSHVCRSYFKTLPRASRVLRNLAGQAISPVPPKQRSEGAGYKGGTQISLRKTVHL